MMMIMMGGGWSSREAERDSRESEREGQGKAGSGGRSGGEGDCFCRLLFSRVGAAGGRRRRENKRNKLIR